MAQSPVCRIEFEQAAVFFSEGRIHGAARGLDAAARFLGCGSFAFSDVCADLRDFSQAGAVFEGVSSDQARKRA